MEDRYGVRVMLVAVTAAGGLVDVRYKVLDPLKARQFGDKDLNTLPLLVPEGSDLAIRAPELQTPLAPEAGQMYYILYPNPRDGVKPGSTVTIRVDDLSVSYPVAK